MSLEADGCCEERRAQMQQQCEFNPKVQHFLSMLHVVAAPRQSYTAAQRFDRKHEEAPLGQQDLKLLTGRKINLREKKLNREDLSRCINYF